MLLRTFTRHLLNNRAILGKRVDYAVCIDIECTCDSPVQIHPMELIEIACLKLDLTNRIKEESIRQNQRRFLSDTSPSFHSFVKPIENPELTLFCQELTGILQTTVDNSETSDKVIKNLMNWLKEQDLINENYEKKANFAFASCGNFDLKLLSPIIRDCRFDNNHELPIYFKEWINVKKTFVNHKKEWPNNLYHMMELLGEEPIGRLHSAKDDCKNLARVVECLHREGCDLFVTSKV